MVNFDRLKIQIDEVYKDNGCSNYAAAAATVFANYLTCFNNPLKVINGLRLSHKLLSDQDYQQLINRILDDPSSFVDKLLKDYGLFLDDTEIKPYI